MRVGMQLMLQNHADYSDKGMYEQEIRLATAAEEMGFDMLWPVEHHFFDYSMCPDNMQFLSYLAGRTTRIELATAAVILPWHDPLRVVERMVLLDHLSNGRAVLGLGRGLARREYRGFGVDMSEARGRFNEAAEIVLRGLEEGVVEADGPYYTQARVEVRPRPWKSFKGRRYMVCVSPESFSVAASLGLGVMMFSQVPWESMVHQLATYRKEYRAHNDGEEAPPLHIAEFVVCDADGKRAEETARRHVVEYYWSVMEHYEIGGAHFAGTKGSYQHYASAADEMKSADPGEMAEAFLQVNLWGTPDAMITKLQKRRELIGDFEVNGVFSYQSQPYEQVERSARLFAKEVAPEIRRWQPGAPGLLTA